MTDLKALPWFPDAIRELRAFRLENNSDFTASHEEVTCIQFIQRLSSGFFSFGSALWSK